MTFSTVKQVIIDGLERTLKIYEYGAKTASVVGPFGEDSSPLENMTAIYSPTGENGDNIVIGYINKNQIANPGEKRIFSLNEDGTLSFSIHLKGDGFCEIGGNSDNMIRYIPLDLALQQQKDLINAELVKIQLAINLLAPGAYVPAPINLDISQAKIDKIKTS